MEKPRPFDEKWVPGRPKRVLHKPYIWRRLGYGSQHIADRTQHVKKGGQYEAEPAGAHGPNPIKKVNAPNERIIAIIVAVIVFIIAFYVSGAASDLFGPATSTSSGSGSCATFGQTYCSYGTGYLGQDGLCHCALETCTGNNCQPLACSSNSGCDANSYCDSSYGICLFTNGGSP